MWTLGEPGELVQDQREHSGGSTEPGSSLLTVGAGTGQNPLTSSPLEPQLSGLQTAFYSQTILKDSESDVLLRTLWKFADDIFNLNFKYLRRMSISGAFRAVCGPQIYFRQNPDAAA